MQSWSGRAPAILTHTGFSATEPVLVEAQLSPRRKAQAGAGPAEPGLGSSYPTAEPQTETPELSAKDTGLKW